MPELRGEGGGERWGQRPEPLRRGLGVPQPCGGGKEWDGPVLNPRGGTENACCGMGALGGER